MNLFLTDVKSRKTYQFPFASYPAVRLMLLIMAGIVVGNHLPFGVLFLATIFGFVFLLWTASEFWIRKWMLTLSVRLATFSYIILIVLSGAVWMKLDEASKKKNYDSVQFLQLFSWEEIDLEGTVVKKGKTTTGKDVFVVKVHTTGFGNSIVRPERYKIRLYSEDDREGEFREGSRISAKIRLYEFPEKRNPHDFDYGNWLYDQGIFAHGEIQELHEIVGPNPGFSWAILRDYVQGNIEKIYSEETASLAKALLLGYKEEISSDTRQQFSRSGLSHIMAVSGLHVGFIVAPFWFLIPLFWTRKGGKYIGLALLTLLLIGYAGLTGFSASVCRASLMAWLITYGKLFYKVRNSVNLTAGAAIVLLILNPNQLFDVGFQLSFSAVFVILLVMPEAQRIIPDKHRYGKMGMLYSLILISFIVQAGLFPILAYYFGEFSIAGPLANAFVIPILTVAVPLGLFLSLIPSTAVQTAGVSTIPVEWSLQWVEKVAGFIGESEWSYFAVTAESIFIFLLWVTLILLISSIRIPEVRWKMLIISMIVLIGFLGEQLLKQNKLTAKFTFLDVGQGDAVHVETPQGKHILVDAGRWTPGGNSGSKIIIPYFKSLGVDKIDALILSHPHADHIGGVNSILEEMEVDRIYQSDYEYDSQIFQNFMYKTDKKSIPVKHVFAGEQIELDTDFRIYVVGPAKKTSLASNPNNYSVAIKLQYGNTSVLLTGDAEKQQEQKMANIYGEFLESELYKMGHHGSKTSSTSKLMSFVQPEFSVASLAYKNRFRHPNREAITNVSRFSKVNYFTSLEGAVIFESDGTSITPLEWK